jgi:hypothetical protein
MCTLAGLPTFCPMTFHLFASYSLMASRRAIDCKCVSRLRDFRITPATCLNFREFGIMHILQHVSEYLIPTLFITCFIPVFLHAAFCPSGKRLAGIRARLIDRWLLLERCTPWLFRPSYSLHPASSSAFALPLPSMAYWSDPSSSPPLP